MKFKSFYLIFVFICFLQLFSSAQKESKVLFVGNSYTYFWNLPQQVGLMAAAKEIPMTCRQSTSGGASLGRHWRSGRGLKTNDLIRSGEYDIVVLQDHSRRAIDHPDSLLYFGELYGDMIKKAGAKPYLYLTWARKWDPTMQKVIKEGYIKLAKKIGATVVPVGLAWEKCRNLRPDIQLYDPDGSHPSPEGSYLSACVFFQVLSNSSPVGLAPRITTKDADSQPLFLNNLNANDALFLQKIAEQTVKGFKFK